MNENLFNQPVGTVMRVPQTVNTDSVVCVDYLEDAYNDVDYTYQVSTGYVNTLSYPLVIVHRNNHAIRLPSTKPKMDSQTLVPRALRVDVIITFDKDVDIDVTHILDDLPDGVSPELTALKEAIKNNTIRITYGKSKLVMSYTITDRTIRKNGYSVYVDELDVVICKNGHENDVFHPYSIEGQSILTNNSPNAFSYRVMINDPNNVFGGRYININGNVYHVPPSVEYSQKEGVYIYSTFGNKGAPRFVSFDDADTILPLYTSVKLAEQLGDVESSRKLSEEEMIHERKMQAINKEIELAEIKNKVASDKSIRDNDAEAKLLEIKQKHEELKLYSQVEGQKLIQLKASIEETANVRQAELEKLKHELEMRSLERKEGSELIKWFPAIATAIGAMFNIFL